MRSPLGRTTRRDVHASTWRAAAAMGRCRCAVSPPRSWPDAQQGRALPQARGDREGAPAPSVPVSRRRCRLAGPSHRPGLRRSASVATAFFWLRRVGWRRDAVHDGPDAFARRCAPLVTAPLERRLRRRPAANAGWDAMPHGAPWSAWCASRTVTRPDGAPAPTRSACLPAGLRDTRDHHDGRPEQPASRTVSPCS